MADISDDLSYHGKRRKKYTLPTARRIHEHPRDPVKIRKIIRLRDEQNLSWRQIADRIGTTRMAPRLLYYRWINWAKTQEIA